MRDTKFTPGPWELMNGGDIFGPSGGDSGNGVCADQNDGWQIAEVGVYAAFVDGQLTELCGEVRKKNIAILLSAPELYEALDNLCQLFSGVGHDDYRAELDAAEAALAKARGES